LEEEEEELEEEEEELEEEEGEYEEESIGLNNMKVCEYLKNNNYTKDPDGIPIAESDKLKWSNFCFETINRYKNKQDPLPLPMKKYSQFENVTKPNIPLSIKNIQKSKYPLSSTLEYQIDPTVDIKYLPFMDQDTFVNDYDALLQRAKLLNSDRFLFELNIVSINDKKLYKNPYKYDNFVWILNLFYKVKLPPQGVDENMPDNVYKLFYDNYNLRSYLNIAIQVSQNNDLNLDLFIDILLNFLEFIKTPPLNKYIPSNLNKYIKSNPELLNLS